MDRVKTRALSWRIEDPLYAQVNNIANSQGRTISNMLSIIVKEWIIMSVAKRKLEAECSPSHFSQEALSDVNQQ